MENAIHVRKYFFAYHVYHGKVWPMAWVEEDGVCVGGRPTNIMCNKVWEITESEFNGYFCFLEMKYPVPFVEDTNYQMKS